MGETAIDFYDILCKGSSWSWSMLFGFTITCVISAYHHLSCELEPRSWLGVLDTTLCDKVCQWFATGQWFSLGTPVSSTNKIDRLDIHVAENKNRNIIGSGVKHHKANHIILACFSTLGLAAASDKVYQLLAHGRWFSPCTPVSSTTKTGRHDIAEILLKVALKHTHTKNQNQSTLGTGRTFIDLNFLMHRHLVPHAVNQLTKTYTCTCN